MNIIEEKRLKLGLTQKQIAEMIGVDRTTVGKWELGISIPRVEKIFALSKLLSCSIEDIYSCQRMKQSN
ncbi:helix-turn-helix transcriptional regulator [Pectinatus frisingensis]|jgi:transcriptional regulator with XRE-family HTH domain|uniref:helix-turn-helix transcriptional regulator n=1 Tax=Pectinatus frisingensis TaxID=865 RepID=UPI0018C580F9|nr:helix-turn-helix transcriptional regulator [Pectinatus frisingensis]